MSETEIEIIRVLGCLGALGSFAIMVADWIGWTPRTEDRDLSYDGTGLDIPPVAEAVFLNQRGRISDQRRFYGGVVGVVGMPFWLLGLAPIFLALSPAGIVPATIAVVLLSLFVGIGPFGHGGMVLINELHEAAIPLDRSSKDFPIMARAIRRATNMYMPIMAFAAIAFALGSFLVSYLIWTADTAYPKFLAVYNLFIVFAITRRRLLLPYSISRWTGPACVHIFAFLPFIVVSTILVWNGV